MSASAARPAPAASREGERLLGCNAWTLDAYLRALGFLQLAGKVDPEVRAWWGDDEVLRALTPGGVDGLIEQLAAAAAADAEALAGSIKTPWRGQSGADRTFVELRNEAPDEELDWYSACAVPGAGETKKRNNPLLGQGGGFGNVRLVPAFKQALKLLARHRADQRLLGRALASSLRSEPLDLAAARALSIKEKVLGNYQSGRGTGPGSSVDDRCPTAQSARTGAWDILLVVSALRLFAGAATRRPDPAAGEQTSFPLLVRAQPVALDESNDVQLREDDPGAYEFLAPLWSRPATAGTVRHLIKTVRVRARGRVARNSLDAIVAQAAQAAGQVGFDRLARFVFVASSDPRVRYALRRSSITARGSRASWLAARDVLPFLRAAESALRLSDTSSGSDRASSRLRRAHRQLANAIARLDRAAEEPVRVQQMLIKLARFEVLIGHALSDQDREYLKAPRLGPDWLKIANDGSARWRLALALAWRHRAERDRHDSWLRPPLLGQDVDAKGLWRIRRDWGHRQTGGDRLAALVATALWTLRSLEPGSLKPLGWPARPEDVVLLLGSGALNPDRLAETVAGATLLAAPGDRAASVGSSAPPPAALGGMLATLLLAAHPAEDEQEEDARERRAELVALALYGQPHAALRRASRELWRRGLQFKPWSDAPGLTLSHARLALALMLELSEEAQKGLAERIDRTFTTQGGIAP